MSDLLVPQATHAPGASRQTLTATAPLPLSNLDGPWQVAEGYVDVFAVRLQRGQPAGRRLFVQRVAEGGLLPGWKAVDDSCDGRACDSWSLIAVGGLGAAIAPWPADLPLTGAVDAWLIGLAATLGTADYGWSSTVAVGRRSLAAGATLVGHGADVLWVRVLEGAVTPWLATAQTVEPGHAPVPVATGLPLIARQDSRIDILPTAALGEGRGQDLDDALDGFHRLLAGQLGAIAEARWQAALDLAAGHEAVSRRVLERGLADLASLDLRHPPDEPPGDAGDPAFAVLRTVAAALGEPVRAPDAAVLPAAPLARMMALADHAGLRARPVLLEEGWWRRGGTPLMAVIEEGERPVALLPTRRGYRLIDPAREGAAAVDVTEGVADTLVPSAAMLYRRLPDSAPNLLGLMRFAGRDGRADMRLLVGLSLIVGILGLAAPLAMGLLVDQAIPRADLGQIAAIGLGLAAAALGAGSVTLVRQLLMVRMQGRMDMTVQAALFDRLLRLPVPFLKQFSGGDLTDRVLGIQAIRDQIAGGALSVLLSSIFSLLAIGVMLGVSPTLALTGIGLTALSGATVAALAFAQLKAERGIAQARGRTDSLVLQMMIGIAKLRAAAAEDRAFGQWAVSYATMKRQFLSAQRMANLQAVVQAGFGPLAMMVLFLTMAMLARDAVSEQALQAAAEGLGGTQEAAGTMAVGAFLVANAAFGQLLAGVTQTATTLTGLLGVVPLWERARPILEAQPEDAGDGVPPDHLSGGFEISHVTFAYAVDGPPVLQDLNLSVAPGAFVALVGPSGSGKSTLLRLLLGLETPTSGEIFFDGRAMSGLDVVALRRQIGVVLQSGRIMQGSVLDNIAGASGPGLEDAWAAARLAGLERDIKDMPMGMHTVLSDGGGTLSGGQRQRLMIARALIRKPRLLILDEATSALDNQTQAAVMKTLEGLPITRLIIAHRLSTIEAVDHVLVMDRGRLVQQGPLARLKAEPGLFADLARRQEL